MTWHYIHSNGKDSLPTLCQFVRQQHLGSPWWSHCAGGVSHPCSQSQGQWLREQSHPPCPGCKRTFHSGSDCKTEACQSVWGDMTQQLCSETNGWDSTACYAQQVLTYSLNYKKWNWYNSFKINTVQSATWRILQCAIYTWHTCVQWDLLHSTFLNFHFPLFLILHFNKLKLIISVLNFLHLWLFSFYCPILLLPKETMKRGFHCISSSLT